MVNLLDGQQWIADRDAEAGDEFVEFSDFAAVEVQQVPERTADIAIVFVRAVRAKRDPAFGRGQQCGQAEYFAPLSFPDVVHAGLRVAKVGNSSVRYEIGLFRNEEKTASAQGYFVHVYVDRASRRSTAVPADMRAALEKILI